MKRVIGVSLIVFGILAEVGAIVNIIIGEADLPLDLVMLFISPLMTIVPGYFLIKNSTKTKIQNDKHQIKIQEEIEKIKKGSLPEVDTDILLKRSEICHYEQPATRLGQSTRTSYVGGYSGGSFRIAKGISIRTGSGTRTPITHHVTDFYNGRLLITNERILFMQPQKPFEMPLKKVSALQPYQNAIGLQNGSTYYKIQVKEPEYVYTIIKYCIKRYAA
ncbi:hypothetical protein [Anaerophilus nitritogenes]|uniref:hypothetical protein n=1 Tax=Anaerophilus nitritogenes TaxID=2498136 RepID=UPI00101CF60B|nr:hypothetical protein [Anaerophilus nitritogenes]